MTLPVRPDDAVDPNLQLEMDFAGRDVAMMRWWWKLALMLLSAILMTAAFAPFGQFYLAWIALVPWLMVVRSSRSIRSAAAWGWLGGVFFFFLNLSYLLLVTVPGALALPFYLAIYWAIAAGVVRGCGLLDVRRSSAIQIVGKSLGIAAVWVAAEWLRGTLFTGLPWLYLGYTQSPLLALCQIADITGVYGVMFIVVLVNAMIVIAMAKDIRWQSLAAGWGVAIVLVAASLVYGIVRMKQTASLSAGPSILVVQPNERNFRTKGKLDAQRQSVYFHLTQTSKALQEKHADLVAWSETTMPPLDADVRQEMRGTPVGQLSQQTHQIILGLAQRYDTTLIVGAHHIDYTFADGKHVATAMRNSAFLYDKNGQSSERYDKIHLVPFGEFIPGKQSWPAFYKLFLWLSPYSSEYVLTSGSPDALTVFNLTSAGGEKSRFVTPICFDDIDPALIARMFRGQDDKKRADFIVNLTNDGWFRWNEQPQHLQHALFRSIENRVPTARAVNTGISGFIDSCGRVTRTIPVGIEGSAMQTVELDSRYTFYSRYSDVFAFACVIASALMLAAAVVMRWKSRA